MNIFQQDVSNRKKIASAARHRKSKGGPHKGCALPSDNLTDKQRRERNGTAMNYKMNEPITWKEFKKYPKDLKEQYVNGLKDTYGVTSAMICDMMGVIPGTMSRLIAREDLDISTSHKKQTDDQKKMWELFLGGVPADIPPFPVEIDDTVRQEAIEAFSGDTGCVLISANEAPVHAVPVKQEEKAMKMREITMKFNGKLDVDSIANSLRFILGKDSVGEINISFTLQDD